MGTAMVLYLLTPLFYLLGALITQELVDMRTAREDRYPKETSSVTREGGCYPHTPHGCYTCDNRISCMGR